MVIRSRSAGLGALPVFFLVKIGSGLLILKVSSVFLAVSGFSIFAQLLLFGAMLNMLAVGGAQNGLVRQVAATSDPAKRAHSGLAAFFIWGAVFAFVGVPIFAFRELISTFLIGDGTGGGAVGWIMLAVFVAGPGQIFCAQLTGRGRAPVSLLAQAAGLIVGTALCGLFLSRGQAMAAACAFYLGATLTVPLAWFFLRKDALFARPDLAALKDEATQLMRYSAAFLSLAVATGTTLFGLRYVYQEAFGLDTLSFWLVAQRVSDTSTQLLGLYMVQFFLPQLAGSKTPVTDRSIILRGWVIGTGAMLFLLGSFSIAPELFVRIFLSEKYIPAISLIMLYMGGDVLRATVALAMHTAFARARLVRYVAIEAFAMALFSAITLTLVAFQYTAAPFIAYITAFGSVACIVVIIYAWQTARRQNNRQ